MEYYFTNTLEPVVFVIPTQDFVNFNLVERFDCKPRATQITQVFKSMAVAFNKYEDVVDLTEAIHEACKAVDRPLTIGEKTKLEDALFNKVKPLYVPPEKLSDYDMVTLDELSVWWDEDEDN